ncbi:LysR family transcriptional regulator [Luteitalea sp. TBR-22]|uniref:LysR substrate-binding domain-containing protein n=1 Tax=Luteitalea sp. TBR-22 TaxID=2802971 RepID=UPI001EF6823E|nr:LysR family transcriptional regulator [Luteitalea sp. TBR-22]
MSVELRHLQAFVVLAEELNFTRAAARLHVVQQALSTRIRQLEDDLGVTLFTRTTRHVALTPAGETLLTHVPAALQGVASALDQARQATGAERGSLVLGLLATAPLDFTPRLLRALAAEYPHIDVTMRNVAFDDPTGGVRAGETDVALVWRPFDERDVACAPLFADARVAVLPADHPLTASGLVEAEALAAEPFVWVDDMDSVARDFWTLAEVRQGRPPRIGAHVTGFEDLFAAVRAGRAVAACPASVTDALPWRDVVTRPVRGLGPAIVAACWRRTDANPLVQAVVACAQRLAQGAPDADAPVPAPAAAPRRAARRRRN